MNMQIQSMNNDWHAQTWRDPRFLIAMGVISAAAMVGMIIGRGQWPWFVALCVLLAALRWPVQLGLGAFALLCPFDMVLLIGGRTSGRSVTMLVAALAAFALLARAVFTRRFQSPPRVAYWLVGLVIWSALTGLWALQPKDTLQQLPTALGLMTLYLAATCSQISEEEFSWVNRMALVGGCAAALYVCYSYSNHMFYGPFTRRASMMLTDDLSADPNYFAASLLLSLSIAFGGFLVIKRGAVRLLMLGAVTIIGLTIFLTMSRGAVVSVIVMILVFLYRLRVNRRAIVLVTCLATLVFFLPADFFTRVEGAVATHGAGRLDIWVVGLHTLQRYGLFGAGLHNFAVAYSDFAGYAPIYKGADLVSHNTYLNVSVELGVLGFFFFVGMILSERRAIRAFLAQAVDQERARVIVYEAAFWAILTSGLFLDVLWRKDIWLILIVLGIALRKREKSDLRSTAATPWIDNAYRAKQ